MVGLFMVASLVMVGCSSDDDDDDFADNFVNANTDDLENRTFVFPNGADGDLAAAIGLPAGQPFTIAIGDFGGDNTAPFTLRSAGLTATGNITVASCGFDFVNSEFPDEQGPQEGDGFTADPCEVEQDTGALRLEDPDTGDSAVSNAPILTGPTGGTGN
jgi:hypothetical protein